MEVFLEQPVAKQEIELEFIDLAPENKKEELPNQLAVSQFEERDGSSLIDDVKEEVKEEEILPVQAPIKVEENLLQVSQPS